jgi:HSP20 family protein
MLQRGRGTFREGRQTLQGVTKLIARRSGLESRAAEGNSPVNESNQPPESAPEYVIRAEIPGIDPAKDVRVTFADGALRLDVERREDMPSDKDHAEFQYGSFFRIVPMPAGVQEKSITARYADGILEITATVGAIEATGRKIPIKIENSKKN